MSSFEFVCELVYALEKKIDGLASYKISKNNNKNTNNLIQQVVNNNISKPTKSCNTKEIKKKNILQSSLKFQE